MNTELAHFFLSNVAATQAATNKLTGNEHTAKLLEILTAVNVKVLNKVQKRGFNALFSNHKQAMSEMMNAQMAQAKELVRDANTLARVGLLYLSNSKKLDLLD